jgi:hypothetical protein
MRACGKYRADERLILGFGVETHGKEAIWKSKA